MAVEEGFHRIRLIGKILLSTGLLILALAVISYLVDAFLHAGSFALGLAPLGMALCVAAAALLLAVWVAEGFCEPRQPPGS